VSEYCGIFFELKLASISEKNENKNFSLRNSENSPKRLNKNVKINK